MNLQNLQRRENHRHNIFIQENQSTYDDYQPVSFTDENSTNPFKISDLQHQSIIDSVDGFLKTPEGFECSICYHKSKFKSFMIRHMSKHTHDKPFKCDLCHNRFSQSSNLYAHLRQLHPNEEEFYKCFICSRIFIKNVDLKKHLECHRMLNT